MMSRMSCVHILYRKDRTRVMYSTILYAFANYFMVLHLLKQYRCFSDGLLCQVLPQEAIPIKLFMKALKSKNSMLPHVKIKKHF